MRQTKKELVRIGIPLLILIVSFLYINFLGVRDFPIFFTKAFNWGFWSCATHLLWIFLFGWYIDTKEWLDRAKGGELKDAVVFLGICLLRGLFYYALISSGTQGI